MDGLDIFARDRLTGDWWGTRASLEDRGYTFKSWFTEIMQAPVSGGGPRSTSFGSKLNIGLTIDGKKAGL